MEQNAVVIPQEARRALAAWLLIVPWEAWMAKHRDADLDVFEILSHE